MSVPGKNSGTRQRQVFLLRLPQSLKEHLKQQAKANSRSQNSEILARLEAGRDGYTSQSLVIKIFSFFQPADNENLWFILLYGLFSATVVSILGFIVGYLLIPKFYSNALRELSERTENMDERSATYRLNAMLAAVQNHSNAIE